MKTKALLPTLVIGAICQFAPQICQAQDVDSMAPVVVKTVPEAGNKDVAPGEMEIQRHLQQGHDGPILDLEHRVEGFRRDESREASLRHRLIARAS